MYDQPSDREQLETEPILPHTLPAGREGGVESICSSDAVPIDTWADYGILYLFLKHDRDSLGNFKTDPLFPIMGSDLLIWK
jgi:hypothetical protein